MAQTEVISDECKSGRPGSTNSVLWNKNKLKALWESLLDVDAVSKLHDDKDLQCVTLLTDSIFTLFRGLKQECEEAQKECKKFEENLMLTSANLEAMRKNLKMAKEEQCWQCTQLQKELLIYKEKLEQFKSIVAVLRCNSDLECMKESLTSQKRTESMYNMMHNILLENGFLKKKSTEKNCAYSKTSTRGEKLSSRKNLFRENYSNNTDDKNWGDTLAPESCPPDENIPPDSFKNRGLNVLDALHGSPINKMVYETGNHRTSFPVTPKRTMSSCDTTLQSSPVLGSSNKKYKMSHFDLSQKGSSSEHCCNIVPELSRNCSLDINHKSPSLLKLDAISSENNMEVLGKSSNKSHAIENGMKEDKGGKQQSMKIISRAEKQQLDNFGKKIKADIWNLKPMPSLTKLKQTTLSIAKLKKTVDLSKTQEFFHGGDGYRNSLNNNNHNDYCDEETTLAKALQEPLKEIKIENVGTETEEHEDIVNPSPTAEVSKRFVISNSTINSKSESVISSRNSVKTMHCSQLDETLFAPAQTSTCLDAAEQFQKVPREEHEEEVVEELKQNAEKDKYILGTSFDRIPQKPTTSPNYKYRQQGVRKRILRQKMEGWECAQCKNYYDALGVDLNDDELKQRKNHCSRHRDKYQYQFNTPPGYWDVNVLTTQDTNVEAP